MIGFGLGIVTGLGLALLVGVIMTIEGLDL